MSGTRRVILPLLALTGALVGQSFLSAGETETLGEPVRIGMINSLFRDTPEALVKSMMQPFSTILKAQTGRQGTLVPSKDAAHLGQLLAEGKVDLAVFHGVEFAWARSKYPKLRPLVIAINQQRHLRAVVLVPADSKARDFADLEGKKLTMSANTREHCHLFLDRRCQECVQPPKTFFGQVVTAANAEDVLDDLVEHLTDAALVDEVALNCYQHRKPMRFARLRVVQRSEIFPAAVVAYQAGSLNEAVLRKFRDGMLNAHKEALGRQFMTLWKMTAFEPVPEDYDQTLTNIAKTYPPPVKGD